MTWRPGFATLRTVGHVDIAGVSFSLPDGRPLLRRLSLRVGEGAEIAPIGPNGTGKTTLTRIISGDLVADEGAVTRSGGLGVMRQFVGQLRDDSTGRDLLVTVAPAKVRKAAAEVDGTELLMMEHDTEAVELAYAQALVDWGDAGGYEYETLWDTCTVAAIGIPFEKVQWRQVTTLSGGEHKRLVLEALLRGPEDVLLLDEPDNYLDVPAEALARGPARGLAQDRPLRLGRPRAARTASPPGSPPSSRVPRGPRSGCIRPVHDLRAGPPRTATTASRSGASGGTRSTPSSRRWS